MNGKFKYPKERHLLVDEDTNLEHQLHFDGGAIVGEARR
jgi:hypothetical protein